MYLGTFDEEILRTGRILTIHLPAYVDCRSDFASIRKQCLHPTKQDALLGQIASSQITVQKSWSFSSKTKKQKQVACSKKKDFKRLKGENYQDKLATKISSKLLKKQRR